MRMYGAMVRRTTMVDRGTMRFAVCLLWMVAAWPTPRADACGGFFCDGGPPGPPGSPAADQTLVDQAAEQIVFHVDEGVVTAHIQIAFAGRADDFGWILPTAAPNAAMWGVLKCAASASIDSQRSKIRTTLGALKSTENA